jgi:hypothetical protein
MQHPICEIFIARLLDEWMGGVVDMIGTIRVK